jgi:uncharacterized protein (DUF4415 family)
MRFEWDEAKNEINRTKHGIEFETAQLVFDDPCCVTFVERLTDGDLRPGGKGNYMPKLSAENRKELPKLAARPDREIDLTDIPEIQEIPSDAVIGKFYRPKKTIVTIRLDADVVAWIKASGEGYQTRINAYLRQMMQQSR